MTQLVMNQVRLGELHIGQKALIVRVGNSLFQADLIKRLLEMGFLEGSTVEVLHVGAFGQIDAPIAVRVRGSLIALRRSEANAIKVQVLCQD